MTDIIYGQEITIYELHHTIILQQFLHYTVYNFYIIQFLHKAIFNAAYPALAIIRRGYLPEHLAGKELPLVALARHCSKKANPQAGIFTTIGAEDLWIN